jgi:GntR family transcriptional regulator
MTATGSPSRHAVITAHLREQIGSGVLAPGAAIPSEAELAERFRVSRGTVRQALAGLRAEGLINGGRGRRPVVSKPAVAQSFDELVSFSAWAEQLGRTPSAHTLELARRPAAAETAAILGIPIDSPVFQYRRLRRLDGEPMMLEVSTFIEPIGRLLLECDMDGGSVYAQLGQRGVAFAEAQQSITAVAAGAEQAELLRVARRAPLLKVTRLALDPEGRPLEYSLDTYRADAFAITIHNRAAVAHAGVGLALVG